MAEPAVTEDALLAGAVRLLQPQRGHRAGMDAVVLAECAAPVANGTIVDLGSASGAVGLMIARLAPAARIVLVERDPVLVGLARWNISLNGIEDRAEAVEADVFGLREASLPGATLGQARADLVVTNPPFFEARTRSSPDENRRAAHDMAGGTLVEWLKGAASCLKPRGTLVMIHRADHLDRCLAALPKGFGGVVVTAIQAKAGEDAVRVVISARKGGRAPLRLAPPRILGEG